MLVSFIKKPAMICNQHVLRCWSKCRKNLTYIVGVINFISSVFSILQFFCNAILVVLMDNNCFMLRKYCHFFQLSATAIKKQYGELPGSSDYRTCC